MRKVIAAMNMTLDGFCDHTLGIPDEALHHHYAELISHAGVLLYGRITYQLMEYWKPFVKNPSGNKAMDEFAIAIDNTPKLVFSHTLKTTDWESATLATRGLEEELSVLKAQPGNPIFICSPGLIAALTQKGLIDEYQLCIHPVIAGKGLPLFKNISEVITLKYIKTKPFHSGVLLHYYEPIK